MTVELEALEDANEPGVYLVQVCEYPAANKQMRAYQVYTLDDMMDWCQQRGARAHGIVYGWHGPLRAADTEVLDDPTETGYYAVWMQPWPAQTPKFKEMRVCVWRNDTWYDQYGWAKQYGNVLGWVGPFPMLPIEPQWLLQHEAEQAAEIGL